MKPLKKIGMLIGLGLTLAWLLSACESLPFDLPWLELGKTTATLPPSENGAMTPTPETTLSVTPTPEPVTSLTLWVPPEMDPNLETKASRLFANRLQVFSDLNDGIEITVRVKAMSGAGGLLDALTATSAAAPDALPDLIALPRPDLENAALKGLIFPLDGLTEIPDDTDWYGFTREMALLQGSTFGLPFAADSLILVYRPAALPEFPSDWTALVESGTVLAFSAGSDSYLFPMALYQAAGGIVQDNQRRPALELEPLTEVFRLIDVGAQSGTFPDSLIQYQTTAQVWTAFREGQVNLAVSWFSNYLKEGLADTAMVPLLPMSDRSVSYGTGMSWAVASPQDHRHPVAVSLAEYLVQPEFLSEWTAAGGYLPPRPSALEGWQNQGLRGIVSQVALMTKLQPSNDIIASLGPVLREATRQIIQDLLDPVQAAQIAVESLEE